jgi:chromosomal replication initiator protein
MGLIADIQQPEVETKIAIIHKKAEHDRFRLPEDVAYFIASRIKSNIRDIEGALIRLGAHASLTGSPVDLAMAKTVLRDLIPEDEKPLTVEAVIRAVAEHFGLRLQDMRAPRRSREIVLPRQIAMYIARELTGASLNDIGKNTGGKDHATVIYACRRVEGKRAKDEDFRRMLENLINKLKP